IRDGVSHRPATAEELEVMRRRGRKRAALGMAGAAALLCAVGTLAIINQMSAPRPEAAMLLQAQTTPRNAAPAPAQIEQPAPALATPAALPNPSDIPPPPVVQETKPRPPASATVAWAKADPIPVQAVPVEPPAVQPATTVSKPPPWAKTPHTPEQLRALLKDCVREV